jgi:hypothetical protein
MLHGSETRRAGIEQRPDDKVSLPWSCAGVTDPISFFGAQRFPDVVVHREMLESGQFAGRLLLW